MSHTAHGSLVGFVDDDGLINPHGAVLVDGVTTVAVVPGRIVDPETFAVRFTDPVIAAELAGRVNKSDDTVNVLYLMDADTSTMVAAHLLDAIERAAGRGSYEQALDEVKRHVRTERNRRRQQARG